MVKMIKFELFDWERFTDHKLLATSSINIKDLETNNLFGQFMFITFYSC